MTHCHRHQLTTTTGLPSKLYEHGHGEKLRQRWRIVCLRALWKLGLDSSCSCDDHALFGSHHVSLHAKLLMHLWHLEAAWSHLWELQHQQTNRPSFSQNDEDGTRAWNCWDAGNFMGVGPMRLSWRLAPSIPSLNSCRVGTAATAIAPTVQRPRVNTQTCHRHILEASKASAAHTYNRNVTISHTARRQESHIQKTHGGRGTIRRHSRDTNGSWLRVASCGSSISSQLTDKSRSFPHF